MTAPVMQAAALEREVLELLRGMPGDGLEIGAISIVLGARAFDVGWAIRHLSESGRVRRVVVGPSVIYVAVERPHCPSTADAIATRIEAHLARHGGRCTAAAIAQQLMLDRWTTYRECRRLAREGRLVQLPATDADRSALWLYAHPSPEA